MTRGGGDRLKVLRLRLLNFKRDFIPKKAIQDQK